METNKVNAECPVCGREFKVSEIEGHVDRCLFLNSENKLLKRNSDGKQFTCNGTSPKRIKVLPDTETRSSASHATDVSCYLFNKEFFKFINVTKCWAI